MMRLAAVLIFFGAAAVVASDSQAQEQSAPKTTAATTATTEETPPPTQSPRGKRIREKEAEGTQAPNRFEADTVIKSKYQADGQPLEVDPD